LETQPTKIDSTFDFSKSRSQMLVIEAVRVGFLWAILVISLAFQALQPEFVNVDVLIPVYILMAVSFVLNGLYLMFIEKLLKVWVSTAILFFFEAIFITSLIHYTGVNQSIFLFLYLVNIIVCGLVFQRRGALVLSLWTSILFSLLMILGPDLHGQTLFFSVGLNNLAFFAVAALSGLLSEQLNFMGSALLAQGKDLRALRNLNSLIVDNIATGLVTFDESGRVLLMNRAALEILDSPFSPVVGRSIEQVIPGLLSKAQDAVREFHGSEATEMPKATRFDLNYKTGPEDKIILEMIVSLLPEENEIRGYIITFQDLTRVRRLEFQMRQSEKMAAVGQLAAGIAHEIRNPLASISGSIQLLGSSFSSRQEEEQKLMAIVLREVDRLNNLITEFLDFVRPDALRDDPVDVNSVMKEVFEIVKFNKVLRQDVKQLVTLHATQQITGHRDKLKQAFLNIMINAYQAMGESAVPELVVSTSDLNGKVIIKIKDSGSGIDEANLRKIFEPFHTTKPKGTGLGLAVTHKIVEHHGGQIFVESVKGVGTEFTLEFPVRTAQALDKNALADSHLASENFSKAFRGQKRGNG
jgi:two-component system sensor histidine kinase PilS (NtrC family)